MFVEKDGRPVNFFPLKLARWTWGLSRATRVGEISSGSAWMVTARKHQPVAGWNSSKRRLQDEQDKVAVAIAHLIFWCTHALRLAFATPGHLFSNSRESCWTNEILRDFKIAKMITA